MATLKSMKLTAEEAKGEYSCCPTSEGDAPKYPYGLNLCLGDEALAKLGMGLMPVGTEIMVMAKAVVTGVSARERQGGEKHQDLELQITDMDVSAPGSNRDSAIAMNLYGPKE